MKPRIIFIHDRSQTNSHMRTAGTANVSEPMRIHHTSFHAPLPRKLPTLTGKIFRNVWGYPTVRRVYGMSIIATYLWFYSPLSDLGRFFSLLILYTVSRTHWTKDQSVARPLPTHRIKAYRYPCLAWDSNPRSQRSCLSAAIVIGIVATRCHICSVLPGPLTATATSESSLNLCRVQLRIPHCLQGGFPSAIKTPLDDARAVPL
jgi:hypothetical protein